MNYTSLFILCINAMILKKFIKESYSSVKYNVVLKYNEWKSLNNLVATRYENKIQIVWYSMVLLFEAFYISFIQYMNKSVCKLRRNTYLVTYVIEGKVYKMFVIPNRGPCPILQISNQDHKNVTKTILPYMGPNYNWHNINITPKNLEQESLHFEFSDGKSNTYEVTESLLTDK